LIKTVLNKITLPLTLPLLLFSSESMAVNLDISGFLSVIGGKVIQGKTLQYNTLDCPCYIGDYVNNGVYEGGNSGLDFGEESRLGLRANLSFSEQTQLITQIVSNSGNDYKPDIGWFYVSHDFNDQWSLDAGRKRIPLFAYSDYADVGYSLPWIRVSPDTYGWAVESYNGANVDYLVDVGEEATLLTSFWVGEGEVSHHEGYEDIYYWEPVDIKWSKMIGVSTELVWDWFSTRLVYMNSENTSITYPQGLPADKYVNKVNQDFYGISMGVDYDSWMIRSEYTQFNRDQGGLHSGAFFGSVGYHIGPVLPAISWSRYADKDKVSSDHERHEVISFSVRWDFYKNADVKFQYDDFTDKTNWGYIGDSEALSIGVDYVF
jgi:hypothetical protein